MAARVETPVDRLLFLVEDRANRAVRVLEEILQLDAISQASRSSKPQRPADFEALSDAALEARRCGATPELLNTVRGALGLPLEGAA